MTASGRTVEIGPDGSIRITGPPPSDSPGDSPADADADADAGSGSGADPAGA